MTKPKIKINFFASLKYLYPVTISIILIVLAILINFLYNNVYKAIIQAELITDLRKEITEENIERPKFEEILKNIKNKQNPDNLDINNLKNPFTSTPAPITTPPPAVIK